LASSLTLSPAAGLDDTPIAGSPSAVTTVNAAAAANTSTVLLNTTQEVGQVRRVGNSGQLSGRGPCVCTCLTPTPPPILPQVAYGVLPFDAFGNACTFGRPSGFTAQATRTGGDGEEEVVLGAAVDERYLGVNHSETVALSAVTRPGEYTLRLYLHGELLLQPGVSPVNVTVAPGATSARSTVSTLDAVLPIGLLTPLVIQARDRYGNAITVGGAAAGITVRVVNVAESGDAVSLTATDAGGGRYEASLRPNRAGRFNVTVQFPDGAVHAAVQQFTAAMMSSTPDMYAVVVTEGGARVDGVGAFAAQAGVALSVTIRSVTALLPALDASAAFTVTLSRTDMAARSLLVTAPDAFGRRTVTLNETTAGGYWLAVHLGSTPLAGSPFAVAVAAGAPVGRVTVALGGDDAAAVELVAGDLAGVVIHAWDEFGNAAAVDFEAEVGVAFSLQPGARQVVRAEVRCLLECRKVTDEWLCQHSAQPHFAHVPQPRAAV
jgi:hypothetical protein